MTTVRHQTHDHLLNRVRLTQRRLSRLATELDSDDEQEDGEFRTRVDELATRSSALAEKIKSWTEVEIGSLTEVEDLAAAVETLEADLMAARAEEPADYEDAVDRQVRGWRTRIDRLRLQSELASMESRDELEALADRLEEARAVVLDDLQNVIGDARETVTGLRSDMEQVLVDVRKVVERVAATLTRN